MMEKCSIGSFIEETNRAATSKEVSELFAKTLKNIGYDRFCYSLITPHPSLGLPAGHGIERNYPEDWMAHYKVSDYAKLDPIPRYGRTTSHPFTWETAVRSLTLNAGEKKVMNEAREAGLLDGLAIPICGRNGELAGVGMASSTSGATPDINLLYKIRALALQFHIAYSEHVKTNTHELPHAGLEVQLTNREKEILLWAAEGKSDMVIAEILGVAHTTIRFHMNNIFKKLDANERTFATVKAIRLGLIVPSFIV